MSSPVKPFDFRVDDDRDQAALDCSGDGCMYKAEVRVWTDIRYPDESGGTREGLWMFLCRSCLRRMRATLKEAEKLLPKRDSARPVEPTNDNIDNDLLHEEIADGK